LLSFKVFQSKNDRLIENKTINFEVKKISKIYKKLIKTTKNIFRRFFLNLFAHISVLNAQVKNEQKIKGCGFVGIISVNENMRLTGVKLE